MRCLSLLRVLFWLLLVSIVIFSTTVTVAMNLAEKNVIIKETERETEKKEQEQIVFEVPRPDVSEQFLTVNDYSRPGNFENQVNIHF